MTVDSDRIEHFTNCLRKHFKDNRNKQENLLYLISACPKQKPSSIAKRLVYIFEEDFSDYIRDEKYQNEMRILDLQMKATEEGTWNLFWKTFQHEFLNKHEFLKKEVNKEAFWANPADWLESHKRIALAFQIEENLWNNVGEVHEHLAYILNEFEKLPSKYRKFVFFFIFRFPDLHAHRSVECQSYLKCLDSLVAPEDFHKLHIHRLDTVKEGDVGIWAYNYICTETAHVDHLLAELRRQHPNSPKEHEPVHYDMATLETMQYEAYIYLRDTQK
jgi:hypothetical protein